MPPICECRDPHAHTRIVLSCGPGAGKTAALELVRQHFCKHAHVLRESAGIVFGGGFPRAIDGNVLRAAQRAIFYRQRELEADAEAVNPAIVLCDRGRSMARRTGRPKRVLDIVRAELRDCCRGHRVPTVDDRREEHHV